MQKINYIRTPRNDDSEIHICYRCSNEYAKYAPVAIFSVLTNNPDSYNYIYIFTDYIADDKWEKIKKIFKKFNNNELIKIIPDTEDIIRQKEKSVAFHGWDLIHISLYYQKYLSHIKKVFNFGIDSFCVGDLSDIWNQNVEEYHYIGNMNRHQHKSIFKKIYKWIGMDVSLLNLEKIISDGISPDLMEDHTIKKIGCIHDEVAFNDLCLKKYLDTNFYYIYSGSYLPKRRMHKDTILVDFYNRIKPWEVAIPGYEIFDRYISYYNSVSNLVDLEYILPLNRFDVSKKLRLQGRPFIDWFPYSSKFLGEFIYRMIWACKKLFRR